MEEIIHKPRITKFQYIIAIVIILSISLNILLIANYAKNSGITGATILTNPSPNQKIDNNQNPNAILHYNGLRAILEHEIENYTNKENVGLFVQDIKTGAWMGVNERQGFSPASLLKTPIMMAILKKVDRGEIKLDDIVVIKESDIDTSYANVDELKEGDAKTIEELLTKMIKNSDNTAKNALRRQLLTYEIDDVFKHVGIQNPYTAKTGEQTVSPRDYTRLFKALYYSTFTSPKSSEFALALTTNTQTENLLTEGVPEDVEVAHKFGIYDEDLLHDCGIIYHNKNPYFICVMTKNMGSINGADLIRRISGNVYRFVDETK